MDIFHNGSDYDSTAAYANAVSNAVLVDDERVG